MNLKSAKTSATKKRSLAILGTGLVMAMLAFTPLSGMQAFAGTGNGTPSGSHYNLNIIGQKSTNCPQTDGSGGNRIFVALKGHSDILLTQGPFAVLDDNACNDGKASFQLPAPGTYTVWAKVVGTPGGSGTLTTCATDPVTLEQVCSLNSLTIGTRDHGNNFQDVTKTLTTICTTTGCVDLFSPQYQDYLWSYDNNGNKVLQLRFYQTS